MSKMFFPKLRFIILPEYMLHINRVEMKFPLISLVSDFPHRDDSVQEKRFLKVCDMF